MSKVIRAIPILGAFVPPPIPKAPDFPPIPPIEEPKVPSKGEEEAQIAAAETAEQEKQRKRLGRKATILTSPLGESLLPTNVKKTTLLGG